MHEIYITLSKQLLHQQRIKGKMEYLLSFKKIRTSYLKDNCPAPKHRCWYDGVSSWPAVSGAQFMTQFQGKAKEVLFKMPCRPCRRMDKAFSCSGRKEIQKLCYSDPSHSFSQNITLKVTCFDRALA